MSGGKIPEDHAQELTDCFAVHAPELAGYAWVLACGDGGLAGDLVQATFIAAAGEWPAVRCLDQAERPGWLRATADGLAVSSCLHCRDDGVPVGPDQQFTNLQAEQ